MATGTQVPWTTPGETPCCCEEPFPCVGAMPAGVQFIAQISKANAYAALDGIAISYTISFPTVVIESFFETSGAFNRYTLKQPIGISWLVADYNAGDNGCLIGPSVISADGSSSVTRQFILSNGTIAITNDTGHLFGNTISGYLRQLGSAYFFGLKWDFQYSVSSFQIGNSSSSREPTSVHGTVDKATTTVTLFGQPSGGADIPLFCTTGLKALTINGPITASFTVSLF